MTGDNWPRLADYIRHEMRRRGWTQRDLAAAARTGEKTVNALLSGKPRRRIPYTLPAIEQAIDWPPGGSRRVLAGGEPRLTSPYTDPAEQHIWSADTLPATERHALIAFLRTLRSHDRGELPAS